MPAPTNLTAATALGIDTLPYSLSLDVSGAVAPDYDVWWSFASAVDGVVGFKAAAASGAVTYAPETTLWYGAPSSLTQVTTIGSGSVSAIDRPIYFPVLAGVTYYLRIRNSLGSAPDVLLEVSAAAAPNGAVAPGSLLISTVDGDMPIIALDAATGAVLGFPVVAFPPGGDFADILPSSGRSIWPFGSNVFRIYDSAFALVAEVSGFSGFGPGQAKPISTNRDATFYVCAGGSGATMAKVQTVSNAGVIGGTTWTLGHASVISIAPSLDEATLYYTVELTNAVYAWNLGTNAALPTFATHSGSNWRAVQVIVLADTSVLVLWAQFASPFEVEVIRYNAAGVVQNTFTFGATTPKLIAHGPDDPTSFWIWTVDNWTATFERVRVSDGVALASFTTALQSGQVYARADYATTAVADAFVPSSTCPFLLWYAAQSPLPPIFPLPPPGPSPSGYTTETLIPRRLRRAPHLSLEQRTRFYGTVQVDLECGRALATGQGRDPQIMLRWSDDGGHTWSNEHWRSAGRMGQYAHRALWQRGGRSRDRIFEVVVSDPVPWNLLQMILDVQEGLS